MRLANHISRNCRCNWAEILSFQKKYQCINKSYSKNTTNDICVIEYFKCLNIVYVWLCLFCQHHQFDIILNFRSLWQSKNKTHQRFQTYDILWHLCVIQRKIITCLWIVCIPRLYHRIKDTDNQNNIVTDFSHLTYIVKLTFNELSAIVILVTHIYLYKLV